MIRNRSGPAKTGGVRQLLNAVDNPLSDLPGGGGIVFLDVFDSSFQFGRTLRLSAESASRVKEPVDTVNHVSVLYKLAPLGLLNSFLYSSDETGLVFEHTGNSVFH